MPLTSTDLNTPCPGMLSLLSYSAGKIVFPLRFLAALIMFHLFLHPHEVTTFKTLGTFLFEYVTCCVMIYLLIPPLDFKLFELRRNTLYSSLYF